MKNPIPQRLVLLLFLLFTMPEKAHAHSPRAEHIVTMKDFAVPNPANKVFVLIRKDGKMINRPFVLELRALCGASETSPWSDLEVNDSESLCGVDPKSIAYDPESNEIRVEYFEPDTDFNARKPSDKAGKGKQHCLKERKTLRLPVVRLCL